MNDYCIHLSRTICPETVQKYGLKFNKQRLSYDLTNQTKESISELSRVMNEFAKRSNGEFEYWITEYGNHNVVYSLNNDKNTNEFIERFVEQAR